MQDVNFRRFAKKHADNLSIFGYVENCVDETVLVIAQAEKNVLEEFLQVLKKGPSFSKVEKVEVEWNENLQNFKSFDIR